jgi:cytochrome c-type biogenesis protein CcmH
MLLTLASLGYVVRPLLREPAAGAPAAKAANLAVYRDQRRELEADLRDDKLDAEQHEAASRELEKRLLDDMSAASDAAARTRVSPLLVAVLGAGIPLCALGIYLAAGSPQALFAAPVVQAGSAPHDVGEPQIRAMVERLAARLQRDPEDVQGWTMLGRSYQVLGQFGDAAAAFAEAVKRAPGDAQLLADYADALGMKQGRSLAGEPEKVIARALKADPDNVKALALAGTAAFDRKDYARAVQYWQRIAGAAPPGSDIARSAEANVAEARARMGSASAPGAAAAIRGIVHLSPALARKAAPTDTVFIYARSAEGPRMPLAILRKQVRDLPLSFALDDSMGMSPALKLSSVPRVVVAARVSKTAQAARQPGDLEGETGPVATGAQGVQVLIDREVP